ncbi:MAG: TusE/DsrC/DsvC family sulfur relay protein [Buchnera aphidicola (Periphyllus acericola)]|uniref:TusE/DsrC/DsvC family sulfur relay protein n=1 Tax=Buchnera aphidicola TaxID=9 RepID=UPI0030D22609|nr:TusE/DsrC/DsvC family sulfur relay protein [Buchnera aphidicola (Periphyllus acericola)]
MIKKIKELLWNKKYAVRIAKKNGIKLNKNHWRIIKFTRNFYYKFYISPSIRILLTAINKKYKINITSIDLIKLFPKNPSLQISKISGIPKPNKCF